MAYAKDLTQIRTLIASHKRWDMIFGLCGLLALMVGVLTFAALFIDMAVDGLPRLSWDFVTSYPSRKPEQAGILSAWVGSCLVMLVTAFFAVPLGVASGIYLEEYAPKNWVTDVIEINITNLAGVPSIIYGLLALGLFVYQFGLGQSILAAGLTLALLILPVVIVAYALGSTKWQVSKDHIIPYSMPGILTGVIIGMARAIGETAPVITIGALTFIAFLPESPLTSAPPFVSFEWLFAGFTVMPIQMFNWTSRPEAAFLQNAAAAGFVLVLMTLAMNAFAIWLRYRLRKRIKW
jgi:phosphate transport system permease protein